MADPVRVKPTLRRSKRTKTKTRNEKEQQKKKKKKKKKNTQIHKNSKTNIKNGHRCWGNGGVRGTPTHPLLEK